MTDSESLASDRPEAATDASAARLASAIGAYVRARDSNRPHLMKAAFTDAAVLQIRVEPGASNFNSDLVGRKAIVDTLVTRFNQAWENIYTFCIGTQPQDDAREFSCDWMMAMSAKRDGMPMIGWGRYDWHFEASWSVSRPAPEPRDANAAGPPVLRSPGLPAKAVARHSSQPLDGIDRDVRAQAGPLADHCPHLE